MIAVDSINREKWATVDLMERTQQAFHDAKFDNSVRQGTNNPVKVRLRVETMQAILRGE
ncbi:hypothetical protein GCM10027030_28140 [Luteococcus sediminum]